MSPPSRGLALAVLLLGLVGVLVVLPGHVGAAAQESDGEGADWDGGTNVSWVAQLDADGDARWTLTTTINLTSQNETEAFRTIAADFENGDLPPLGLEAFQRGLEGVNGQTEREMEITDIERSTASESEIRNGNGRLTVEFTWVNFARETDDQLHIDRGVLVMENGDLWFKGLGESQSLTIAAPEEYGVRDATVSARNGELHWEGPIDFEETSLQAVFIGPSNVSTPVVERSDSIPWILFPVGAAGIVLAVLLSRSQRQRGDRSGSIGLEWLPFVGGASGEETEDEKTETKVMAEHDGEEIAEDDEEVIDEELLSDEERVERLLSSNGGRMKQADIVKETDWSNAKVSQLLSSMEEEDRIDKLRIGRENLISFPDEDITDTEE